VLRGEGLCRAGERCGFEDILLSARDDGDRGAGVVVMLLIRSESRQEGSRDSTQESIGFCRSTGNA
jgi:hypothetical protein